MGSAIGRTPGTWVARRTGDRWGVYAPSNDEADGMIVAYVEPSRPGFSNPTDALDAKLMAAAPDLLDALEFILPSSADCFKCERNRGQLCLGHAAIAKATAGVRHG